MTNQTEKQSEKRTFIEWTDKEIVVANFTNLEDFKKSGYVQKLAKNFGYEHLIADKFRRYEESTSCEYLNFYITKADPVHNYGLDFKIWSLYRIHSNDGNDGILFFNQVRFSSSITSAPLRRVMLFEKGSEKFAKAISKYMDDPSKITSKVQNKFKKLNEDLSNNTEKRIIEAFRFSTNAWYKKDMKYRKDLADFSKSHGFIYN